jgi:hypothetical protein
VSSQADSKSRRQHILKYDQLMKLSKEHRVEYLKGLRQVMLAFGSDNVQISRSFFQSFLFSLSFADEDSAFRCLGAGFPIRLEEQHRSNPRGQECGRSSLDGFSDCPSGQRMCNPFIFGVSRDGSPVCMTGATTERCFDRVVTGITTFFPDDLFDSDERRESYNAFLNDFEELCNGDGVLSGGQRHLTDDACELARRQMRANLRRVNGEGRHSLNNPLFNSETMGRTAGLSGYDGNMRDLGDGEIASGAGNDISTLESPTHIYPNIGEYLDGDGEYEEFLRLYRMFGDNPALQNSQRALVRALAFYANNRNGGLGSCEGGDSPQADNLRNQEWITISDLTLPSSQRRIFFLNTRTGEVVSDWSSHGSGSNSRGNCTEALLQRYNLSSCRDIPTVMAEDLTRDQLLTGSTNVTRGGFFEIAGGAQGPARWGNHSPNYFQLIGLQSTNWDARRNSVVMHAASYVNPGSAGRSYGCPTTQMSTFRRMNDHIGNGSLMYIHTINEDERGLPEC